MITGSAASSIYVIVRAFNEAQVIADTLAPLLKSGYHVVVIDDGSSDRTWDILQDLPLVRIRHLINLGPGAALETGMEYARRQKAGVVVHFDADGQHDPTQIPEIITPILSGRADIVFGSRFIRAGDSLQVPRAKRLLLRGGRIFSGLMTGVWLTDTHNGFRGFSGKAVAAIKLKETGFAYATEMLDVVGRAGLKYVEVPTTIRYTSYSIAKGQPMSNAFNIVLDLIIHKLFR